MPFDLVSDLKPFLQHRNVICSLVVALEDITGHQVSVSLPHWLKDILIWDESPHLELATVVFAVAAHYQPNGRGTY